MKKYFNKLFIIDGSYQLQRCLHQENLWELKTDGGIHTGGIYGFLKLLNSEMKHIDAYPVVCWDAGLSKRRLELLPNYKHNLDKVVERVSNKVAYDNLGFEECLKDYKYKLANEKIYSDAVEAIKERVRSIKRDEIPQEVIDPKDDFGKVYHDSREALIPILDNLGVPSIKIGGQEGDDLMTLLTRLSEESIVMTDDRDLIQLVSPTVKIYRPMAKEWIIYDEYLETLGIQSSDELIFHKAICGDGSDNIPSVTNGLERKYSLGAKRAWNITKIIYESNEDPNVYLPIIEDLNKNYYKGFVQRHDDYIRNMKMVDLRLVPNDEDVIAQIVNTVMETCGKTKLFNALGELGKYKITNFDANAIVSKNMMMFPFVMKGSN